MPKKFLIKTLGCKVNQCESEAIGNALIESGRARAAGGDESAEVVIVNTCTVTGKAAMQSRQAVRQAIRSHPGARIVVTGCHAQTAAAEFAAIEGVDRVVPNCDKHRIPQQVLGDMPPPSGDANRSDRPSDGGGRAARFDSLPGLAHGDRTRPFVKIQDGCDAFCTYCIVPYARGRSRSLPLQQVLGQIDHLARLGYREVVLTGIHIGCYGQDLTPATSLADLLQRIRGEAAIDRVRISSIEPTELTDAIVDLADGAPDRPGRLCRHFHIPLQSGDDAILRRMHRPYDGDYFRTLVQRTAARLPDAAIGVDTLIGFPGETDAAFERTYRLIADLPVAYLHVFPFSPRKGTPAYTFTDRVPAAVIKERCRRMRRLGAAKRRAFYERYLDAVMTVLVEETRVEGGLKGLTDNYVPIRFDGPDQIGNTFQRVTLLGIADDGTPVGRLV